MVRVTGIIQEKRNTKTLNHNSLQGGGQLGRCWKKQKKQSWNDALATAAIADQKEALHIWRKWSINYLKYAY